jgi:hypothetical protein
MWTGKRFFDQERVSSFATAVIVEVAEDQMCVERRNDTKRQFGNIH